VAPAPGTPPEPTAPAPWARELSVARAVLVDGRLVQTLADGTKVRLTIDPELQQTADRLLKQNAFPYASVVVLSVKTGNVLALSGASTADPGLTAERLATQAWAPAASVFKLVTAAALVERNKARPMSQVCYHGGERRLAASNLVDDPVKDKTCHTLADAIALSLNPVIGKLARKHLSREDLLETANRFGFNLRIDTDLTLDQSPADIPRDDVARAKVAAGFWHTNLSPLHGALLAQAFAAEGVMLRPRLVDQATGPTGKALPLPEAWKQNVMGAYTAKLIGRMMVATTTVGTARDGFFDRRGQAYLPDVRVAGKTGSLSRPSPPLDYNWFVGFAPYERPQVAFAVLLGNPVKWRTKPYTLAMHLLRAALARKALPAAVAPSVEAEAPPRRRPVKPVREEELPEQ
jgi:cell division protein FtsI/penicillin-binding protein 2